MIGTKSFARALRVATFLQRRAFLCTLTFITGAVFGAGTVTSPTEENLRAAMAGGGTVAFACDGTLTLANTITNVLDTVLDGSGHRVVISGGSCTRVFYVSTNTRLTLIKLTISDGKGTQTGFPCPDGHGPGGAVFNDGGMLNIFDSTLTNNSAGKGGAIMSQGGTVNLVGTVFEQNVATGFPVFSSPETGEGGGVFIRGGDLNATNCRFSSNSAYMPTWDTLLPAHQALGGAIRIESGTVALQDCVFIGNSAVGAAGWYGVPSLSPGADGLGGAIHNNGALTVARCTFLKNAASGGAGGNGLSSQGYGNPGLPGAAGGAATGGAICNQGTLELTACTVASNNATAGNGGNGGTGAIGNFSGPATPGGDGADGGTANGAAIYNSGAASAVNCTFVWNIAVGGIGGGGGSGGFADVHGTSGANGGAGGAGGSAYGGVKGGIQLTNCTVAFNGAFAANGGSGGYGGAGIPPGHAGTSGSNGSNGLAGGGLNGGACLNTLLATNSPGGNNAGALTDLGHNLSSDSTCTFTNVGSLNNTDPKLAPLADNGGLTLTMALLSGSPAIDAGDAAAAPATDQRGVSRPFGVAADIGAYEYAPLLHISRTQGNALEIRLRDGVAGQSCRLLTTATLADWQCVATNQIGLDGTVLFQDNCGTGEIQRFYKVALP